MRIHLTPKLTIMLCIGLCLSNPVMVAARDARKQTTPPAHTVQQRLSPKAEMAQHTEDLRQLMWTLYSAHPEALAKSTQVGAREMTDWVFENKAGWQFEGLRRKQGMQALDLLFDPTFQGDQVLALIVGLETLLYQGYGAENEFAIPPAQDTQLMCALALQLLTLHQRLSTLPDTEHHPLFKIAETRSHIIHNLATLYARVQHQPLDADHPPDCQRKF